MAIEQNEILKMYYENAQNWIRHYDTLILSANFFSSGVILGYFGLKLQAAPLTLTNLSNGHIETREIIEIIFPALISAVTLIFTIFVDWEVRRAFTRLVRVEKALGFYDDFLSLNGEPLLDNYMSESGLNSTMSCKMSYGLQGTLFAAAMLYVVIS